MTPGRFIVIGASGLIGDALVRTARGAGREVIGTYTSRPRDGLIAFDMTRQSLRDVVRDLNETDAVFVLAAQIDPNWVLDHPDEARRLNVEATQACLDDALASGAHAIFMSSEAVFGTDREGGYEEAATPNPGTLYGRLKYEVEQHLARQHGRWCVVRTGWTVGWEKEFRCPVASTYDALLGPQAKMAHDNLLTITDVADVAAGLVKVAASGRTNIVHIASNPPVLRTRLAELVAASSRQGGRMKFATVPFSAIPYREPRAAKVWLRSDDAVRTLGLRFAAAEDVIRRKVALIDDWRSAAG
jgi:dTDP-4-dehydrorhamnose reductase